MANVIAFPLTAEARLRGRIVRAPTRHALERCVADLKAEHRAGRIDRDAFARLVAQSSVTHLRLGLGEAAHG